MGGRDTSPMGIPKSPSFHSGLDLVASASVDSLVAAQTSSYIESLSNRLEFSLDDATKCVYARDGFKEDIAARGSARGSVTYKGLTLPLQKNARAVRFLQSTGHLPLLSGDHLLAFNSRY